MIGIGLVRKVANVPSSAIKAGAAHAKSSPIPARGNETLGMIKFPGRRTLPPPEPPTGRKATWQTARRPRRVPRRSQPSPERTARITTARETAMAKRPDGCKHPLGKGLSQATMCRKCPRRS
jgi:hypothetical protein